MKRLEKRFLPPDNIFKIHWDMIKTSAPAAFYSFERFLTHIRVQILFHFRFLCAGWPGSNPMGPNTCPNSGLQPTAKIFFSRIECCFRPDKMSGDPSLKLMIFLLISLSSISSINKLSVSIFSNDIIFFTSLLINFFILLK